MLSHPLQPGALKHDLPGISLYPTKPKNSNQQKNMNANPKIDIDSFFENIITSYQDRIQKIQSAFQSSENITESSHNLFDNVQASLDELKKERSLINARLCETLAKNGSFRKKDYNSMMSGILSILDEKEKEAEKLFLAFIENQKETAQSLKGSLLSLQDSDPDNTTQKIKSIKEQLAQILQLEEMRKDVVMKAFIDFQNLHKKVMECLEDVLEKGSQIKAKDIKSIKYKLLNDLNLTN